MDLQGLLLKKNDLEDYRSGSLYCDSGLDNIESPGILAIIDGPEHDELSQVYSHLSSCHVGSHVPAYP